MVVPPRRVSSHGSSVGGGGRGGGRPKHLSPRVERKTRRQTAAFVARSTTKARGRKIKERRRRSRSRSFERGERESTKAKKVVSLSFCGVECSHVLRALSISAHTQMCNEKEEHAEISNNRRKQRDPFYDETLNSINPKHMSFLFLGVGGGTKRKEGETFCSQNAIQIL